MALDDASLLVRNGTVHALLGENGAGKTTLMHVAYGMIRPDNGQVIRNGKAMARLTPASAIAAGIGMVHQHFTLVPEMTVQENLALGGHGPLSSRQLAARVSEAITLTGFAMDPHARVDSMSVGGQQRIEIAKALGRDATLLVLDEPTAALAPPDVDGLLHWLRAYVKKGNAAVLISHKLREALSVADDVTVLRRGRVVYTGVAGRTTAEALTRAMMGHSAPANPAIAVRTPERVGAPVFKASDVCIREAGGRIRVQDASFLICAGELIGIAALDGAGQQELLRALAGRCAVSSGRLDRPAIVGFIPEDRHRDAVLLDRSLTENVALRGIGFRSGVMNWRAFRGKASASIEAFDIRAKNTEVRLRTLSGGNQQKLVLARELASIDQSPVQALVAENPTRGLDVRATRDVHARLRDACRQGAAVVVYASDLDEVLALASRVLVMTNGRVVETALDRNAIGTAMLGVA